MHALKKKGKKGLEKTGEKRKKKKQQIETKNNNTFKQTNKTSLTTSSCCFVNKGTKNGNNHVVTMAPILKIAVPMSKQSQPEEKQIPVPSQQIRQQLFFFGVKHQQRRRGRVKVCL